MRAVVQRVSRASVSVDGKIVSEIEKGLLVLLGLAQGDSQKDLDYIKRKILNLRIFENEKGLFDKSLIDIDGELLLVSQFTLLGDCKKGNRPSFTESMKVDEARTFFEQALKSFQKDFSKTRSGEFQAHMKVELVNNGPVTIVIDSRD